MLRKRHRCRITDAVFLAAMTVASIGFYTAILTPISITLAIRLQILFPTEKAAALGQVLGWGAFFALLANPLFGMLSDRTRTRYGRRRPWILGGALVGTLAQYLITTTSDLTIITVAWCIVQSAYNAMLAALSASVADHVPWHRRGLASALMGISTYVGLLIGSGLVSLMSGDSHALFVIPSAFGLVTAIAFVLLAREKSSLAPDDAQRSPLLRELILSFWLNPVRHPDFSYAWLSRFFVCFGFAVLNAYQVYFLSDHLHITRTEIGRTMFLSTLITTAGAVGSSIIAGHLSDRLGRRKIFVLASALTYGAGIAFIMLSRDLRSFYLGVAVAALGYGVYFSVEHALVIDILPDARARAGQHLGIINVANTVPQSLAPALAPLLLSLGADGHSDYTPLYCVAVIAALLGALTIIPVRRVQ